MAKFRNPNYQKIRWVCEKCGATGKINYKVDPENGINWLNSEIREQHQRDSPLCSWDTGKIRIYVDDSQRVARTNVEGANPSPSDPSISTKKNPTCE